ncbi:NRDE family protein [Flavobacteriaceae bacterium S356]|uniref:NRDE family protein n=1 Tax=Asprobacillus argus TaxID=3076534 RepID=A0ABU3LBT5_9FLAO|nr:NRDE family protein [Flavobacteriaceae bacterium S356]
MCTVTYIPIDNERFIFTSNRDESPMRKTIPPMSYVEGGVKMIYPKDQLAGGTWIGVSEKDRLVCLLNGGFEKHTRNSYYRMSRGVVVKNILSVDDPVTYIKEFDFENIEPFTIVLVDWSQKLKAFELVWDGTNKHFNKLENAPKIWSSSTLYDAAMKKERIEWFDAWLKEHSLEQQEILNFHQDTHRGTEGTSLKMKRPFVETVSITSIKKQQKSIDLTYLDFINKKETFLEV